MVHYIDTQIEFMHQQHPDYYLFVSIFTWFGVELITRIPNPTETNSAVQVTEAIGVDTIIMPLGFYWSIENSVKSYTKMDTKWKWKRNRIEPMGQRSQFKLINKVEFKVSVNDWMPFYSHSNFIFVAKFFMNRKFRASFSAVVRQFLILKHLTKWLRYWCDRYTIISIRNSEWNEKHKNKQTMQTKQMRNKCVQTNGPWNK